MLICKIRAPSASLRVSRMLNAQGRYGEAEALQRQILQALELVPEADHPKTFISLNNLASFLS